MEDYIKSIIAVINTLQTITIPATENNLNAMLGCLQVLTTMKQEMEKKNADSDAE